MTTASVPECKCSLRTSLVGDGCSVCNPRLSAEIDAENAAEERLHDAAPDLLAALYGLFNGGYLMPYASDTDEDIRLKNQARAAIAKASPC